MPWFNVDDGFYDHPKVDDLPLDAVGLWTLTGAYCMRQLTDGVITESRVRKLGGTPESVIPLIEAGLWLKTDDGYQFKDWGDWQLTRAQIEEKRERERLKKQRQRRNTDGTYAGATQSVPRGVPHMSPGDTPGDSPGTPEGSPPGSHSVQSNPIQSPTLLVNPDGSTDRDSTAQSFDEWWGHWPKKVKKKNARDAFTAALKALPLPALIEKTDAWVAAFNTTGSDRKFMPDPERWLKHRRWEDDLSTTQQPNPPVWDPRKDGW